MHLTLQSVPMLNCPYCQEIFSDIQAELGYQTTREDILIGNQQDILCHF